MVTKNQSPIWGFICRSIVIAVTGALRLIGLAALWASRPLDSRLPTYGRREAAAAVKLAGLEVRVVAVRRGPAKKSLDAAMASAVRRTANSLYHQISALVVQAAPKPPVEDEPRQPTLAGEIVDGPPAPGKPATRKQHRLRPTAAEDAAMARTISPQAPGQAADDIIRGFAEAVDSCRQ